MSKLLSLEKIKQIVEENGQLKGWDFSNIQSSSDPQPWDYLEIVRQYLKPTDRVLDIGTGGGERFFTLAPHFAEAVAIDQQTKMIETAQQNLTTQAIKNITLMQMEASDLQFEANSFDVVLLRHLRVYVDEILRVLRPGGYFITQLVGQRTSLNMLHAFDWTPTSFGREWWQTADELAEQFRSHNCRIIAQGEFDVPYWFHDVESVLFFLMAVPWPEQIDVEKHWQNINRYLTTAQSDRGYESNEHCGLLVVQKM